MRQLPVLFAAIVVALLAAGQASAQDTPPPGCRWMGDTLACKDGRGAWRRVGDDEIVGTYPMPKPKPKPAAAPKVAAASRPAAPPPPRPEPAPLPPPVEAAPVYADAETPAAPAAVAEAVEATEVAPAPPQPAVSLAEPPKSKSWWQALLDWFSGQINELLKLVGLAK